MLGAGFDVVVQSSNRPPSLGLVLKMVGCWRETPGPFREKSGIKPATNLIARKKPLYCGAKEKKGSRKSLLPERERSHGDRGTGWGQTRCL